MLRQLSADWQHHYGHPLLVAESFVAPQRFAGTLYAAANWTYVGNSKGYARCNGHYTDPHGHPKRLYVRPLRRDARRILSQPGALPDCWQARPEHPPAHATVDKRSLYAELEDLPDYRRGQGRKHSIATVLTVYLLAALVNFRGPVAAAEYAQSLTQKTLKEIGAWRNRRTGRYHPPPKSTIHRVLMHADTEHLEAILLRYSQSRLPAPAPRQRRALAADGKRIRGANRHGSLRYETATLVEHGTGVPLASLNFHDENGELAAVGALLETVPIADAVITLDALHTTRDTAAIIVEQHQAHYQMTVKQNSSETYAALVSIPWEQATARFSTAPEKAHGRIERRHIEVMTFRPTPSTTRTSRRCSACAATATSSRVTRRPLPTPTASLRCLPPKPLRSNCWPGTAATGRSSRRTTIAVTAPWLKMPAWRGATRRRPTARCATT